EALRDQARGARRHLALFCVGDPKQSIYRFRDVDRDLIQKTEQALLRDGGVRFNFVHNRRSTPTLLKLVNAFSTPTFPEALASQAHRQDVPGTQAGMIRVGTGQEKLDVEHYAILEAKQVADQIENLGAYTPLERLAVLYRASSSVLPLVRELQSRGIPYTL